MKRPRAAQPLRAVLVTVMMAAWFVAFDHCALASVFRHPGGSSSAEEHCPGHQPPKKKPDQPTLPCCKVLVATKAPAKIGASYDLHLFVARDYPTTDLLLALRHNAPPSELDTGPPDALTFTETVLQRSILAHAPPCLS